jgi:hypothetical protein
MIKRKEIRKIKPMMILIYVRKITVPTSDSEIGGGPVFAIGTPCNGI